MYILGSYEISYTLGTFIKYKKIIELQFSNLIQIFNFWQYTVIYVDIFLYKYTLSVNCIF